jgi:hypothetical protein
VRLERTEIGGPGEFDLLSDAELERLLVERLVELGFAPVLAISKGSIALNGVTMMSDPTGSIGAPACRFLHQRLHDRRTYTVSERPSSRTGWFKRWDPFPALFFAADFNSRNHRKLDQDNARPQSSTR